MFNLPCICPQRAAIALAAGVLAGCASTHNHKTDGFNPAGGGFYEEAVRPGLFRLSATSNMALWPSFSAARETWKARADQLCGPTGFDEIDVDLSEGRQTASTVAFAGQTGRPVTGSLYNANMVGYVVCRNSGLTVSEAVSYLRGREREAKQKLVETRHAELTALGGATCDVIGPSNPVETLYRRGKVLMSLDRHREAMACFLKAQEGGSGTAVYKDVCYAIGQMYESGIGVTKDLAAAKSWYARAGLQ